MKIWDLATRLYHWSQVLLFITLMASGLSGNDHSYPTWIGIIHTASMANGMGIHRQ